MITRGLQNRAITGAMFLAVTRAVDRVCQDELIHKMNEVGYLTQSNGQLFLGLDIQREDRKNEFRMEKIRRRGTTWICTMPYLVLNIYTTFPVQIII
ncbi:hypothetical protein WA026_021331 [Henosepilachna vigintioctopunctata]|uniref:Uncharacterized protein n=1 Tax=Henosepilachna vigintioctopunctata TaxID=420089 RepID=A0AAW1UCB8_9CUCU